MHADQWPGEGDIFHGRAGAIFKDHIALRHTQRHGETGRHLRLGGAVAPDAPCHTNSRDRATVIQGDRMLHPQPEGGRRLSVRTHGGPENDGNQGHSARRSLAPRR